MLSLRLTISFEERVTLSSIVPSLSVVFLLFFKPIKSIKKILSRYA